MRCDSDANRDDRTMVIVLGMHRGGTSLTAQILHLLGCDMASDLGRGDASNPDGWWERWEIVALHDAIFERLGQPWGSIAHSFALPRLWWRDPGVAPFRRKLRGFVARGRVEHRGPWGFKDPRACRLVPLWLEICADLGLEPRFVLALRDPAAAIASLVARDNCSWEEAELLWVRYHADMLRDLPVPVCVVHYERWFSDARAQGAALVQALGLRPSAAGGGLDGVLAHAVKPQHNRASRAASPVGPFTGRFYRAAAAAGTEAGNAALRETVAAFDAADQLFAAWRAPLSAAVLHPEYAVLKQRYQDLWQAGGGKAVVLPAEAMVMSNAAPPPSLPFAGRVRRPGDPV